MTLHPSRGAFIGATAATFASIGFISSPAKAAAQFTFKSGNNQPADHPLSIAMKNMADAIGKESGGRVKIEVFPNSELGGDTAMLGQLRSGALTMMTLDGTIMASVVPVAGIQGVGFGFKDPADAYSAFDGPLGAYVRDEIGAKGIYCFEKIWENGMRHITSSTHPIKGPSDLSNFKIRTPAAKITLDLFKALGASPTPINLNETYTSLQTRVVDGQENPFANIEIQRFYEVQKYLSLSGHQWGGYWLIMNGDTWKSLPPDLQAIFSKNAALAAEVQRKSVDKLNDSLLTKLRTQGMVSNEVDRAALRARLGSFYQTWKGEFGDKAWSLLEAHAGKLG
jgi:tripartite ATP-independent transporter DctP family solute receptor